MKKTMFITSVIMVVVLAIALTTSSLAWFNAGGATSVDINQFQITAKASTDVKGLEISNKGTIWRTDKISLDGISAAATADAFVPLVPVGDLANADADARVAALYGALNATVDDKATTGMWTNTTVTNNEVTTFADALTQKAAYKEEFFIRNSGDLATNVSVTVKAIENKDTSFNAPLWIAIFQETDDGNDLLKLLALHSSVRVTDNTTNPVTLSNEVTEFKYATAKTALAAGKYPDNQGEDKQTELRDAAVNSFTISTLNLQGTTVNSTNGDPVYHPHKLVIMAWFDGDKLDNQNSKDYTVTIDVSFGVI